MKDKKNAKIFLLSILSSTIFLKLLFPQSIVVASKIDIQNSNNVVLKKITSSRANQQPLDKTVHENLTLKKTENKALLAQASTNTNPNLPATEQLPQLPITDVIPIEEYKLEPPKLPEETDEEPEPYLNQPPSSTQQKPNNLTQQLLIEKLRRIKNQRREQQKKISINALTFSASRYPWIVNPTDSLTFSPQLFKPNEDENYIDVDIRARESQNSQVIDKFTYAKFPKSDQFYWLLNDNRLVFETKGSQAGILYQGRSTETNIVQNVTSEQSFWGLQTLSSLPTDLEELTGEVDNNGLSVISIAGQVINPVGIPAGRVVINSGIDTQNANVTVIENRTPAIGSGSTYSPDGGAALFQALDASNTPRIIQGFPTTDLKPLLDEGNVRLAEGEIIPNNVLEAAGIFWGDILTGEGFAFTAPVTSTPGIKIAQLNKFDNLDLLNIAVNPFLTPVERDLSYLNSLFWISFGRRQPQYEILSQTQDSANWHRFYTSYAHNRSIVQYDPVKISATYSNIFAAPGLSITGNFDDFSIDDTQSINSTIGMALGGIFEAIQIDKIDSSLAEARQKFSDGESFAPLNTTATSDQRRQINQRLNRTLAYANSGSGLEQVSGTYTIPSQITPKNSSIFQIRTGNYKRTVQFLERNIKILEPGDTFFSDLRLSNDRFGPLTFVGLSTPLNNTSISPINEATAAEIILTNSQGQTFVQRFSSTDNTVVPLPVRTFDLAFDYMELTRVDKIGTNFKTFNGYLLLPTVEFLTAGSSGGFNYSASLGTWFNIDPNSAPGVSNNNLGAEEPSFGIYGNVLLNYIQTNVELNSAKKPVAVNTHAPSIRINWNSASNRNNPIVAVASYFFDHQERNFGYSLAPAVAFIEDNSNGEFLGLFNGQFSTSTGLSFRTNLEVGKSTFYEVQGLQRLGTNFSAGAYFKNYSTVNNQGLNSRVSGFNYGAIFKYNLTDNNVFLESKLGTGDNGFEIQLQGGYRF